MYFVGLWVNDTFSNSFSVIYLNLIRGIYFYYIINWKSVLLNLTRGKNSINVLLGYIQEFLNFL